MPGFENDPAPPPEPGRGPLAEEAELFALAGGPRWMAVGGDWNWLSGRHRPRGLGHALTPEALEALVRRSARQCRLAER